MSGQLHKPQTTNKSHEVIRLDDVISLPDFKFNFLVNWQFVEYGENIIMRCNWIDNIGIGIYIST